MPTQSEQRPEHDAAVTAEHQREPPAGESGLDTISDAHCEYEDPFRVEHVRVGVTRRPIRRDIDADDFGGLEKPMQTAFRSASGASCTPLGWSPRAEGTSMTASSVAAARPVDGQLSTRNSSITDADLA